MSSHRILVALDGSSCSNAAAEVALQVTKSLPDTRLIGLHVVNVNPPSGNILKDVPGRIGFEPAVVSPETNLAHEEDGASVLDQFRARADELGVHVECVMEHGAVHDVITHHAKHADLLITGLRGETEDRFPGQGGAHVSHLLQDVTVPMLIVPSNKAAIRSVAIGYDGSAGAAHALSAVRNYLSELLTAVRSTCASRVRVTRARLRTWLSTWKAVTFRPMSWMVTTFMKPSRPRLTRPEPMCSRLVFVGEAGCVTFCLGARPNTSC